MPIALLFDLANYTPADASPVQANFQQIEQYLNTEVITRDGLVAMIAALRLANSTPVNVLDAASKGYVDTQDALITSRWANASVATSETTAATAYADMATVGPQVTMTTGRLVRVTLLVTLSSITGGADFGEASVAVSGATTVAAPPASAGTLISGAAVTQLPNVGEARGCSMILGVTPGSNTFTMKYRGVDVGGGGVTAGFSNRLIVVERMD